MPGNSIAWLFHISLAHSMLYNCIRLFSLTILPLVFAVIPKTAGAVNGMLDTAGSHTFYFLEAPRDWLKRPCLADYRADYRCSFDYWSPLPRKDNGRAAMLVLGGAMALGGTAVFYAIESYEAQNGHLSGAGIYSIIGVGAALTGLAIVIAELAEPGSVSSPEEYRATRRSMSPQARRPTSRGGKIAVAVGVAAIGAGFSYSAVRRMDRVGWGAEAARDLALATIFLGIGSSLIVEIPRRKKTTP
jgi:hypothetical protein